jgi:hypothetical protein
LGGAGVGGSGVAVKKGIKTNTNTIANPSVPTLSNMMNLRTENCFASLIFEGMFCSLSTNTDTMKVLRTCTRTRIIPASKNGFEGRSLSGPCGICESINPNPASPSPAQRLQKGGVGKGYNPTEMRATTINIVRMENFIRRCGFVVSDSIGPFIVSVPFFDISKPL